MRPIRQDDVFLPYSPSKTAHFVSRWFHTWRKWPSQWYGQKCGTCCQKGFPCSVDCLGINIRAYGSITIHDRQSFLRTQLLIMRRNMGDPLWNRTSHLDDLMKRKAA